MFQPYPKSMTTGMFAQHQSRPHKSDVLRTHDLIGRTFFEDSILMDTRFMTKGVIANDRLIGRNSKSRILADQP